MSQVSTISLSDHNFTDIFHRTQCTVRIPHNNAIKFSSKSTVHSQTDRRSQDFAVRCTHRPIAVLFSGMEC